MKEARYILTQDKINNIANIAATKAVELYRSMEKKAQEKRDSEILRVTKKKLQAYRRVKASLEETYEFTEDEKIELRWDFVKDLMGSGIEFIDRAEDRIKSIEKKRRHDSFDIQSIDRAISLYKKEADNTSNEEFQRRYRELYALYIDDMEYSIKEIAEMENVSEKSVYRDVGIACKIVAVYLFGM